MKKILVLIVAGLMLSACVGCGSGDSATSKSSDSSSSEQKAAQEFKVGDVIDFAGEQVTVTNVKRNYDTGNQFSVPKSGNEFVKVSITIKNNSDSNISVSPIEFKLQNSAGAIESIASPTYSLDDQFDSAELVPGGTKSGAVLFEVPKGDTGLKLIYEPSIWADQKLEINL